MSTPINSIKSTAVHSAEFIFTGPESLRARTVKPTEPSSFRSSNLSEGR